MNRFEYVVVSIEGDYANLRRTDILNPTSGSWWPGRFCRRRSQRGQGSSMSGWSTASSDSYLSYIKIYLLRKKHLQIPVFLYTKAMEKNRARTAPQQ